MKLFVASVIISAVVAFTNGFDLTAYFGTANDGSRITWAHGVNSKKDVNDALNNEIMMLETDVSMGIVSGTSTNNPEPIMAHPPLNQSDINLNDWLDFVISYKASYKKGIKLDFKFDEVLEPSFQILQSKQDKINFPLIINADILAGPINPTAKPVNASLFLSLCKRYFPSSIISPGWTTSKTWNDSTSHLEAYSWRHVHEMAHELRRANISQPVTFPIRATFIAKSFETLTWLTDVIPNSSLTVWMGVSDIINMTDLIQFRQLLPANSLYFDLPNEDYLKAIRISSLAVNSVPSSQCGSVLRWPYFLSSQCVTAGSTTLIMEGSLCVATFSIPLSAVVKQNGFVIKGIIEFLNNGQPDEPSNSMIIISFGQSSSQLHITSDGLIKAHTDKVGWHIIQEKGTTFGFEISIPKTNIYQENNTETIIRLFPSRSSEYIDSQDKAAHHKYKMQRIEGSHVQFQFLTVGEDPKVVQHLETPCLHTNMASVQKVPVYILILWTAVLISKLIY